MDFLQTGLFTNLYLLQNVFSNINNKYHSNSKVSRETLYECVGAVLQGSVDKKRNFLETVELQISLKNYDPQKDKRFSGSVKLDWFMFYSVKFLHYMCWLFCWEVSLIWNATPTQGV